MRRLKIHRSGAAVVESGFPARNANAPFVAGLQSGKSPFRPWRHQVIAVQDRKIEKISSDFYTNGMQSDIFRASPAKSIAVKSGHWIATTTFQFRPQDIGWHHVDSSMT
jgi:hypothetical protein